MGTFSAWSYTADCTIWTPTMDEYDQPVSYARANFKCSFKTGGSLAVDSQGQEFSPLTTVYLEAADADAPVVGAYLTIGRSTADVPPAAAEVIRSATGHDPSLFSQGLPDRVLVT